MTPAPEEARRIRPLMRNYFSSYFLWTARDAAARAQAIETPHSGESRFDIQHRAFVLSSILASASFFEAAINELFQDAHDRHNLEGDGYLKPLSEGAITNLAASWSETRAGRDMTTLEKWEFLLEYGESPPLDRGTTLYQDAKLVVMLRNALVHYQPETLSADDQHAMGKHLRSRKFPDNRLMGGSGNPWWPDKCLGRGCATWAVESVVAFADRVVAEVGISPHYKRAVWAEPGEG